MQEDVDVMVETCANSFSDCSDFLSKSGSEFISQELSRRKRGVGGLKRERNR